VLVIDVDDDFFDRLQRLPRSSSCNTTCGRPDAKLEAFAAHVLDQDGQLQFAPAGHGERVGSEARPLSGDVAFGFLHQALADHAGLVTLVPSVPASGLSLTRKVMEMVGGSIGWAAGLADGRIADGVGHGRLGHAGKRDDVTCFALLDRHALQTAEGQHLRHAAGLDRLPSRLRALIGILGVISVPETMRPVRMRPRNGSDWMVVASKRNEPSSAAAAATCPRTSRTADPCCPAARRLQRHPALLGPSRRGCGKSSWSSLASRAANRSNTSSSFVGRLLRLVDLVDGNDRLQAEGQRFAEHELGLRHRAFGGVDQKDYAVHHVQDTLHLAAEIGVAWGVDDVDAGVPSRPPRSTWRGW
jgi:hypothetical protein